MSDWYNQSAMRVTIQKMVDKKGKNNPSKDSRNIGIISAFTMKFFYIPQKNLGFFYLKMFIFVV